jgi:membrane protein required for colicin V production
MENFNVFDWIVLGYLGLWLLIVIRGLIKGLIRQLGGLVGLVVGFLVASWWSRDLAALLKDNLGAFDYWSVVAFGLLFLGGFIACLIVAWFFHRLLERAELKRWDRVAGGLFALIKGFVLGLVLVFICSIFFSENHPMVKNMRLRPTVEKTVGFVYDRLPQTWQQDILKTRQAIRKGLGMGKARPRGIFEQLKDAISDGADRFREWLKKGKPGAESRSGPAPMKKPSGSGTYHFNPVGGNNSG